MLLVFTGYVASKHARRTAFPLAKWDYFSAFFVGMGRGVTVFIFAFDYLCLEVYGRVRVLI
jgi:hypothetical protein